MKNVTIDLTNVPPDQVGPVVTGALHAILKYASNDNEKINFPDKINDKLQHAYLDDIHSQPHQN